MDGNLLFEMLSAPARQAIFRSMAPLAVGAGEAIIRQGDTDATLFYVLEKGSCDVLVAAGAEPPKKVHTYSPGRRAPACSTQVLEFRAGLGFMHKAINP